MTNNYYNEYTENKEFENMNSVPKYVTYEARDSKFREKWLPPHLLEKLNTIREQVKKIIEQHESKPSVLKNYTPHGVSHCKRVEENIYRLIPGEKYALLSEYERFYLLGSAWLHDTGMYREAIINDSSISSEELRDNHHLYSEELITSNHAILGIEEHESIIFSLLAHFHRKKEDINKCSKTISDNGISVRLQLISAYLRLADGLHVDQSRAQTKEYAIAQTYGMSPEAKMHWIRSKLISGIDIDTINSQLIVHLKYPSNLHCALPQKNLEKEEREFRSKIEKLYSVYIMDDIRAELESVRNILIKNKITMFIDVKCVVHKIFFEERFLKDIYTIISSNILLKNPSSSMLYKSFLTTISNILNDHDTRKMQSEVRCNINNKNNDKEHNIYSMTLDIIYENSSEMLSQLNNKRRCHFQLRKLLENINIIIKSKYANELQEIYTICEYKILMYINNEILSNKNSSISYNKNNDTFNNLTSELQDMYVKLTEMEKIYSNKNQHENKLLNDKNKFDFINIYIKLIKIMFEKDKVLIRSNASRLISQIKPSNYAWWIIKNYVYRKSNQIIENKTCDADEQQNGLPHKIGIMLYGYSGSALDVLCGFRDVIISEVIKNIVYQKEKLKDRQSIVRYLFNSNNKNIFEKEISEFFEIFVCECQPKNVYDHGRLRYHDGYEYISALKRRNFTNITLIADAISGTILTQYYKINNHKIKYRINVFNKITEHEQNISCLPKKDDFYLFPRINFIIFGANGMDDKYVYHSAGHLTSIYGSVQKGRTDVILAAQSAKYNENNETKSREIPYAKKNIYKKINNISYTISYDNELTRDTFFNDTAHNYFNNEDFNNNKEEETIVYTPAEDLIRFYDIDYIITEFLGCSIEDLIGTSKYEEIRSVGPKKVCEDFISKSEHMGQYIAPYLKKEDLRKYRKLDKEILKKIPDDSGEDSSINEKSGDSAGKEMDETSH